MYFVCSAQSCKQTMACLKLVYWLKAVSLCLCLFFSFSFFECFFFFCQETFQTFFTDVPEEKHAKRKQD